jgi:hypothetical protein
MPVCTACGAQGARACTAQRRTLLPRFLSSNPTAAANTREAGSTRSLGANLPFNTVRREGAARRRALARQTGGT